jgi:hypothetical protein
MVLAGVVQHEYRMTQGGRKLERCLGSLQTMQHEDERAVSHQGI